MEEFKNKNTSLKSVIILLSIITIVVGGVYYYYFVMDKNISIPENDFVNQIQNISEQNNDEYIDEDKNINPEVIIEEANTLEKEEEEIDKMIEDLGELNI